MMYQNKLVASIKCRGKICKEIDNTVYLPFNEDYSFFLKNLDKQRRAVVNIDIDGKDVLDGSQIVIEAGGSIDLKRHLFNGDLSTGPKFRFVERTKEIEETRGIGAEDGLINISFGFEENPFTNIFEKQPITWYQTTYPAVFGSSPSPSIVNHTTEKCYEGKYSGKYPGYPGNISNYSKQNIPRQNINVGSSLDGLINKEVNVNSAKFDSMGDVLTAMRAESENGITVKGEDIKQNFTNTFVLGTLTDHGNIVIQIKGQTPENQKVKTPVTRKSRVHCSECGKSHKAVAKFCQRCGNNLKY